MSMVVVSKGDVSTTISFVDCVIGSASASCLNMMALLGSTGLCTAVVIDSNWASTHASSFSLRTSLCASKTDITSVCWFRASSFFSPMLFNLKTGSVESGPSRRRYWTETGSTYIPLWLGNLSITWHWVQKFGENFGTVLQEPVSTFTSSNVFDRSCSSIVWLPSRLVHQVVVLHWHAPPWKRIHCLRIIINHKIISFFFHICCQYSWFFPNWKPVPSSLGCWIFRIIFSLLLGVLYYERYYILFCSFISSSVVFVV